uniref:Uncharacterized protein n=1 Tax=Salix viminalis TaxID=40686 RepID=A0A6N2M713_SALVM
MNASMGIWPGLILLSVLRGFLRQVLCEVVSLLVDSSSILPSPTRLLS